MPLCCICQLTMKGAPPSAMLPHSILKRKHYDKPIKLSHSLLIDEITNNAPNNHPNLQYRDTLQLISPKETLSQYHNFSSIVTNIKPFVLARVERDRKIPIHFFSYGFYLLRDRCRSLRQLAMGKLKKYRI